MEIIRESGITKRARAPSDLHSSTRWQAQVDAVSIIHSVKMRAHPQSAVGLMSMGGKGPEVLSTFTTDFGSILAGLHDTKIHGTSHLSSSIQVAGVSDGPRVPGVQSTTITNGMDDLVGTEAPLREVPTATNHCFLLFSYRGR